MQMGLWRTKKNGVRCAMPVILAWAIRLRNTSQGRGPQADPEDNDYAYSTSFIIVYNTGREGAPHAALRSHSNQK